MIGMNGSLANDSNWINIILQQTFGKPCHLPLGANVLNLLWTYTVKDPVSESEPPRKKARCVCNGKPSNKNTAIFGYTFTKMLDHVGSLIFGQVLPLKTLLYEGSMPLMLLLRLVLPKFLYMFVLINLFAIGGNINLTRILIQIWYFLFKKLYKVIQRVQEVGGN